MMQLKDFHFDLPQELIARYPLATRSGSRLLCLDSQAHISHNYFNQLTDLVLPGDLLVFNDTKVIPARLMGQKITGGSVEVLVERILDSKHIQVQLRASKAPHLGDYLFFPQGFRLQIVDKSPPFYQLQQNDSDKSVLELIEAIGKVPLPHYMHRSAEEHDAERYQTIYAKHKGSVAAPTAGLHFDHALMQALMRKKVELGYLTLHIGAGTFAPVRVDNLEEHRMHTEYLEVPAALCEQIKMVKARGNRVIAVGTTTMRALETASQSGELAAYSGETSIFIYPGYTFRCADVLITNFHLPCSTLLMLVCAFGGYQPVLHAYREAVKQGYRFYSYGDAMWVSKSLTGI